MGVKPWSTHARGPAVLWAPNQPVTKVRPPNGLPATRSRRPLILTRSVSLVLRFRRPLAAKVRARRQGHEDCRRYLFPSTKPAERSSNGRGTPREASARRPSPGLDAGTCPDWHRAGKPQILGASDASSTLNVTSGPAALRGGAAGSPCPERG
jgi:hypothetical protein